MALFGKKKTAETTPPTNSAQDIQIGGDDANAAFDDAALHPTDGEDNTASVIDFDAIAQDLNAHEDDADMDSFLGKTSPQHADETFAPSPDFATAPNTANIDDELDFDATFDDGSPTLLATGAAPQTGENPFGNAPDTMSHIEPARENDAEELTNDAPMLTNTAPILTSDMAAGGYAPARKSSPLLPILGAAGLLAALGVVGWRVFSPRPETTAPVVVASSPPLQAPASGALVPSAVTSNTVTSSTTAGGIGAVPAPGAPSGAVNQGLAVDGVPIAPGAVVVTGGIAPTVPLTPALQSQLKALWKQGATAKQAGNIAAARAAWTKMLQLRPNHPGIQGAIDKLPAA